MAGVSKRLGVLAFDKQSGAGTPNTTPTFAVPIVSGGIGINREMADLDVTASNAGRRGRYAQRAHLDGTVTILAHAEALGMLLYNGMGAKSTSGSGPYTHTFTMSDTYPSVGMTVYSLVGDSWQQSVDTFVTSLKISGATGENVMVEVGFMALSFTDGASTPSYTLVDVEPRFKYIGSAFKADADSGTTATMTNIESCEVNIDRAPDIRYGTSLTPTRVIPERQIDASMGMIYDTASQGWDFYRTAISGATTAPTTPAQLSTKGSFDFTFGRHPVLGSGVTLRKLQLQSGTGAVSSASQVWDYSVTRPEASPGAGPLEMDVAGPVISTSAGATELTVILVNETAGTVYV